MSLTEKGESKAHTTQYPFPAISIWWMKEIKHVKVFHIRQIKVQSRSGKAFKESNHVSVRKGYNTARRKRTEAPKAGAIKLT